MARITRRSLMKGVMSTSALVALGKSGRALVEDAGIFLNVVLHGLFVMNVTDFCIELLTPYTKHHLYQVGNWGIDGVHPLKQGRQYALRGVQKEVRLPLIDWDCTQTLRRSQYNFTVNSEASFCRVVLPFPASLKLLRCVTNPYPVSDEPPSYSCDFNNYTPVNITNVSLCQVLTYSVPDHHELELIGNKLWRPKIDRHTFTANLHFWAEPRYRLTPQHAEEAYKALSCLLPPLDLRLKVYSTVALDKETGICGFPPEQEMGWSDWASGGGEGVHPTNCCAVIARP